MPWESQLNEKKRIQVAVALLYNACGEVLITRRRQGVHQGGLWEFPGGKLEPGESLLDALVREITEELAIKIEHATPIFDIHHDYDDKRVLLSVCEVTQYQGQARGAEGQALRWVSLEKLQDYTFPAANKNILDYLGQKTESGLRQNEDFVSEQGIHCASSGFY